MTCGIKNNYPVQDEIIERTKSIIHWSNGVESGHLDRKSRYAVLITCGICGKQRWRAVDGIFRGIKTKATKYGFKNSNTGCCNSCQHKLPWTKKYNNRPRPIRQLARGYRKIYMPEHPMADKRGEVFEHRIIMSNHIGRNLNRYEHVHHKNGDKSDNRLENLELIDGSKHCLLTKQEVRIKQLEQFITSNGLIIPLPAY